MWTRVVVILLTAVRPCRNLCAAILCAFCVRYVADVCILSCVTLSMPLCDLSLYLSSVLWDWDAVLYLALIRVHVHRWLAIFRSNITNVWLSRLYKFGKAAWSFRKIRTMGTPMFRWMGGAPPHCKWESGGITFPENFEDKCRRVLFCAKSNFDALENDYLNGRASFPFCRSAPEMKNEVVSVD